MPRRISVKEVERRQRKIVLILFSIALLGVAYVLYDYYTVANTRPMPENPALIEPLVRIWKEEGFVSRFDVASAVLVVNDDEWSGRSHAERLDIVTRLARYCAERKRSPYWTIKIIGQDSGTVLAEMGQTGLRVP
jgi:hypothetical protein